ncbi:hypothetical protein MHO82_20270 [Vibrio sp. Of7-15]|uniref:hypothetical protein n=1 Tax=Vibrio sp. Of7-15 TaxID=2724879 RepID=UPI001EF31CA4|nr:hypothetical protein [Vibrio sp. Of7-15]MCG7499205.1 hypothetical protein [Vibrio sp. Of7-15]
MKKRMWLFGIIMMSLGITKTYAELGAWYGPVTVTSMGHYVDQPAGNHSRSKLFVKFNGSISIPSCTVTEANNIVGYASPSPNAWNEGWTTTWQSLLMTAQAQKKEVMLYLQKGNCNSKVGAQLLGVEVLM